jgi:succinate-semialdehyde dehydrogenase/glutarate-semialdehyde dehydrogenase
MSALWSGRGGDLAGERGLFLAGGWRPAIGGRTVEVRDPATGELVGRSSVAGPADVDAAVQAALAAQPDWAATHPDERAAVLHRAADLIEQRVDAIALLLTREQGKPVPDSRKEILFGAAVLRYYAEEGRRVGGSVRPSARLDVRSVVGYAPVGVAAAIIPWNYPVDLYCWKVGPALAAGCAVVAKPPPQTPLAVAELVDALHQAGLPPGVLADLPGNGAVGRALAAHPGVRLVAATASTETGKSIMRAASDGLKRLALELGGQTPFIVLGDADVQEAAAAALRRSFSNMGQICIAVNRILVDRRRADDFADALASAARALRLGHGTDEGVAYGPVQNEAVRLRAAAHVEDALARGGQLLTGGRPPAGDEFAGGTFFLPTVIDRVPAEARVMHEETFGPVAAIHRAAGDAELLAMANALPYGLAAYVYSADLERAWALAERIEAGAIGINVNDVTELQAPFGGWKLSGMGRELGPEGLHEYLQSRHIRMRVRPMPAEGVQAAEPPRDAWPGSLPLRSS